MNADEYQKLASRTLVKAPPFVINDYQHMIIWNAIGIAGEAGEINDLVKKAIFHEHGIDIPKIAEEIGDLQWYIAALCTTLGLDLSEIMRGNIEKLKIRYPDRSYFQYRLGV
jgi:NTP pyrophosphatase (non-canonical NTP hydrolase)